MASDSQAIARVDKMDKILAISMLLVIVVMSLIPTSSVMAATNTLAYQQGFSNHYNQGFSDGYNGRDVHPGKHTQDYLDGYKAGVSSIQYNHGYVEFYNGLSISSTHQIIFLDRKPAHKNVLSLHHLHAHFLPKQTIYTKISMEDITTEQ
jgi:hypothetical protein